MNSVINPEWATFEGRTPEMFECLDSNGFAVISGTEPPDASLEWSINEFKRTGIPNDAVVRYIGMRFLEIDIARQDANLPSIESSRVEVYANKGFDGSGKPHIDKPFRDVLRSIEVINGTREWRIAGDEQHVVIVAEPGDTLFLRNKARDESCRDAVKRSVTHEFIPRDEESMSLVYARVVPNVYWLLSRLKNRPSKFQSAASLVQKYKDGMNIDR
jgi:hypothetical protein